MTALEFAVHDVGHPFAGMVVWDVARAAQVLERWTRWAGSTPDEATRLRMVTPRPRHDVMRRRGVRPRQAILSPLSELHPEINTFAPVEPVSLTRLHGDPERPTPNVSGSALLTGFPAEAIAALLATADAGSGASLPLAAELRQLGGALDRPHPGAGAMPRLRGQFAFFCGAPAADSETAVRARADVCATVEALAPWAGGHYLNMTEQPVDPSTAYDPATWARLCAIRASVDPDGLFVANHAVPHRLELARQR